MASWLKVEKVFCIYKKIISKKKKFNALPNIIAGVVVIVVVGEH